MSGLLLLLALCAHAELYSPGRAIAVRDLEVIGEDGAPARLRAGEGPSLLLPVFTRCFGTCPITTEALKDARPDVQVVVLSFDPADTPKDLKNYRAVHRLPASWRVVRGSDAAATRAYLDQFGFRVMTSPEGFIHPDVTLALSPQGAWAGTFRGPAFAEKDLSRARAWALATDSPSLARRLLGPNGTLTAAAVLLALGASALFYRPIG